MEGSVIRLPIRAIAVSAAIFAITQPSMVNASTDKPFKPPTVHTKEGRVIGATVGGVNEFLGIPFAKPPVGAMRWQPPRTHGRFPGGVLTADKFGSACIQPDFAASSEDCLYLNVYTPSTATPLSALPVMVWIHGGALTKGNAADFDPTVIVQQGGVIVVTINYRLGYFGFFAQSAIDAEKHLHGNYGLMDQQFALQWVQKNIVGFGGNPGEVTIFGESAGGESVYANVASPTAASLFRGAISESGANVFQSLFDPIVTLATGETTGTAVVPSGGAIAASVGCTSIHHSAETKCLRAVSAATLIAQEPSAVHPFVDGTVLAQTPRAAFASGEFNQVPMISGSNHDEYRYFIAEQYDLRSLGPLTDPEYPTAVGAVVRQSVTSPMVESLIDTEYPLSNYPPPMGYSVSAPLALGALGTDFMFACSARNANLSLAANHVPVYAYEFNDETAPSVFSTPLSFPPGDCHTVELQYLFVTDPSPLMGSQIDLSNTMIGYWTQFAKTLNPNSPGAPTWPQYSAGGSIESLVSPTPGTESDASFDSDHQCSSYWNTF
jgi:para-nitrobenzyl esterase